MAEPKEIKDLIDESGDLIDQHKQDASEGIKESLEIVPKSPTRKVKKLTPKEIKKLNDPVIGFQLQEETDKIDKQMALVTEQVNGVSQESLIKKFSELSAYLHFGLSRLETTIDVLEEKGIIVDADMQRSFNRMLELRAATDRILGLPPKERIEEVHKWNAGKENKRLPMEAAGVIEYLIKNPDNLSEEERMSLVEKARVSADVTATIRSLEEQKRNKEDSGE